MLHIERLIWDPWNIEHIARHRVTPDEVIEVCNTGFTVRSARYGRLMVIGVTQSARVLAIILEARDEGVYYVVTARAADRKERRIYETDQRS